MNVREMRSTSRQRGLTLIELIVVIAIAAILLTVAIGGFGTMFSRKRLEGAAAEIATQLQLARTEAVARNVPTRVSFGTNCHVVHTHPFANTPATTCNGATVTAGAANVVTIAAFQREVNDVTVTREPAGTPLQYYQFDNLTGRMGTDGGTGHGILVGSAAGSWQLRVLVEATGRVQLCTPSGLPGYAAC